MSERLRITRELLAALLAELPDNADPADYLAGQLGRLQNRQDAIAALWKKIGEEEKARALAIGALRASIRELQAECPHWSATFHEDANDPHYECDVCAQRW